MESAEEISVPAEPTEHDRTKKDEKLDMRQETENGDDIFIRRVLCWGGEISRTASVLTVRPEDVLGQGLEKPSDNF